MTIQQLANELLSHERQELLLVLFPQPAELLRLIEYKKTVPALTYLATSRASSFGQIVVELLRFPAQLLAARGNSLGDFIRPIPVPVQQGVKHHSENYEGYEEKYETEGLTNSPPKGKFPDN